MYCSYDYLANHFTIKELTQSNYFDYLHGLISNEHLKNLPHIDQEFYGPWHALGLKLLLLIQESDFFLLILFSLLSQALLLLASSFATTLDTLYFTISFPKHFSQILLQLFRFLLMSYLFSICLKVCRNLVILKPCVVVHCLNFIPSNSQFLLTNVLMME